MTTKVEKSIVVNVGVSTAYNQWTQFEDFPQFLGGVTEVRQLDDRRLHWVAEIAGVKREWEAAILEQVVDQKVAWAATSGATNAGAVYFEPISSTETSVRLSLEYEPEGLVEKAGDKLNIVGKQAESDLEKFKTFIESRGTATGAWRGGVNEGAALGTPGVDAARASEGDSGKAGLSGKVVAGVAAAAVAGVAAAAAGKAKSGTSDSTEERVDVQTSYPAPVPASPIVETPLSTTTTFPSSTTASSPLEPVGTEPLGTDESLSTSGERRPSDLMDGPAPDIGLAADDDASPLRDPDLGRSGP